MPSIQIDAASLIGKYVKATYEDGTQRDGLVHSVTLTRLGALLTTKGDYQITVGNNLRQLQIWNTAP